MSRGSLLLVVLLAVALVNTGLVAVDASGVFAAKPGTQSTSGPSQTGYGFTAGITSISSPGNSAPNHSVLQDWLGASPALATSSWILVAGVWVWRGRVKSRWESMGFDSDTFDLFMKMKGAKTRTNLLDSLSMPKDRLQLAQELGLDWKAVDYHILRLCKYGLVHEDQSSGRVRMYRLTTLGQTMLQLLKEFNNEANEIASQRVTIEGETYLPAKE